MNPSIYLDYAATTPVEPEVASLMAEYLCAEGKFGNPASRAHIYGWQAEEAVERARAQLAGLIGADTREIVWTSGATEADNLAIKGVIEASGKAEKDIHIVTSSIEHKAVLDVCAYIEERGVEVTYVEPDESGCVSVEKIAAELKDTTLLVSVMHVNNETGAINPIAEIGQLCRDREILFHSDAAQSVGKLEIDLKSTPIDLMSISAHKMYGPKGIGALYVRRAPNVKIAAQIHGGGHERGMRSGTLATHQIVGIGAAADIAKQCLRSDLDRLSKLRQRFIAGVNEIDSVLVNGDVTKAFPGIVNLAFESVDGETMLMSLRDLAISSGSACLSATLDPSHVLKAMGYSDQRAERSLRFSFGRYTSESDVDRALESIRSTLSALA